MRSEGSSARGRKLALQKNVKKQSDSVKGNRRDDGLPAAAPKERDSEIMQQKQKKAKEKKKEPRATQLWALLPVSYREERRQVLQEEEQDVGVLAGDSDCLRISPDHIQFT
ncbi:hypothetical protein Celaphus_00014917 [Cervus elaphus hippelaphus]|uniref:Uncharacterized protein n=1 Tax=Cervus elaphus hippelaphus TaxID=46360 RepID=A0A212D2Z9_CEREH|nr:hypothetical protein Celaphus_00014917 [Cervus elaphus hippelaphus]